MQFAKRIFLFALTNILIMVTISFVIQFLGLQPYLTRQGINYQSLAIICLIWGFAGSFISLALSRFMAKTAMGVKLIDAETNNPREKWLIERVYHMARMAELPKMPEVGIYPSPEVNAFATGPSKSRSLVAVSSGILERMNDKELEGVLGHEITHIANGDMVTMTLLQGLINSFVMFLSRIAAMILTSRGSDSDNRSRNYFMETMLVMVFQVVFGFLGMFVIAYFSRGREFRADAGGAKLAGKTSMIAGLQKLQNMYELNDTRETSVTAFKISTKRRGGIMSLLATHPPLEVRIQKLQEQY